MTKDIIIIILLVISLVVIYLLFRKTFSNVEKYDYIEPNKEILVKERFPEGPIANIPETGRDIIMDYDSDKLINPFLEPTRRVPRQDIQPFILKQMIDIPTRGYPDSYSQLGTLVMECDNDCNSDNKILRLFGRQEYPGSYTYEYYTMINSGNDRIKVPIGRRRRELSDGDRVDVQELNRCYIVRLHRFDAPRYYPDII